MPTLTIPVRKNPDFEDREFEVTFPIYSDTSGDNYENVHKRVDVKNVLSVTKWLNGTIEIELRECNMCTDRSGADYLLGLGIYECNEARFNELFSEALQRIERFKCR